MYELVVIPDFTVLTEEQGSNDGSVDQIYFTLSFMYLFRYAKHQYPSYLESYVSCLYDYSLETIH